MRLYTCFIVVFFAVTLVVEGQEKWMMKGYVKGLSAMQTLGDEGDVALENTLHNRFDVNWYMSDKFTFTLGMRNRIILITTLILLMGSAAVAAPKVVPVEQAMKAAMGGARATVLAEKSSGLIRAGDSKDLAAHLRAMKADIADHVELFSRPEGPMAMIPAQMLVFDSDQLDAAKEWIKS